MKKVRPLMHDMTGPTETRRRRRRARRGLAVFFGFVVIFDVGCTAVLATGHGDAQVIIPVMMWSVAVSSILARLVMRDGFHDVSFRFGGRRTWLVIAAAVAFPLMVGCLAYGSAWATGLAGFAPRSTGLVVDRRRAGLYGSGFRHGIGAGGDIGHRDNAADGRG